MECGYKGLVFVEIMVETHCTQMGADIVWPKIPQIIITPEFICRSSKVLDFNERKASLGVRSPCFKSWIALKLETLKPWQQSTSFYVFDLSYADMTWQNRQWQIKYWRSFVFCISFVYLSLAVNLIYCHQHFAIQ